MKLFAISPIYDPSAAHHAHDIAILVTNRSDGSVERFAMMPRISAHSWLDTHKYDPERFAVLLCGLCIFGEIMSLGLDAELPGELKQMPPSSSAIN